MFQIADVVRRVVFLLFLPCFWTIVRRETTKNFTSKTNQPRPRFSRLIIAIISNFAAPLTSSVQYGKILPNLVNCSWL